MNILEQALNYKDRLDQFKAGHKPIASPIFLPINFAVQYGQVKSNFKPNPKGKFDIIFHSRKLGLKCSQIRRKEMKSGNMICFFDTHFQYISDIYSIAYDWCSEKTSSVLYLKMDWELELHQKGIWVISSESCIKKNGSFDYASWLFFHRAWYHYYYNAIHNYI